LALAVFSHLLHNLLCSEINKFYLSTIRNADRILFIKDGEIKEAGTHKELLNAQGFYYGLYTHQFIEERVKEMRILD